MRRVVILLAAIACISTTVALSQSTHLAASSERKVTFRVEPAYPDLARKMHLQGVVKVEATVRPNGTVRSTRILGGNPVLIDAATEAVKKWKFEPNSAETTETVQLAFIPQ